MRGKKQRHKVCLVAVDIRSAHNVGSMFRTCDGFGAEIFLIGVCPRPIQNNDDRLPYVALSANKQIAKTALGAEKTVSFRYVETFAECCDILRGEGFRIVAIEQSKASTDIRKLKIDQNTALIVGREVEGLNTSELKRCDEICEIPMRGNKESLNVSVAAAIALYQVTL